MLFALAPTQEWSVQRREGRVGVGVAVVEARWAAEVVIGQTGTAGVKPPPHTPLHITRPLLTQPQSGSSVSSIPLSIT